MVTVRGSLTLGIETPPPPPPQQQQQQKQQQQKQKPQHFSSVVPKVPLTLLFITLE